MSRFFCLWIPDFHAWAAARAEPHLQGKPVVVYASGRVIAASPLARQAGAQSGWTVTKVQALLPDCILVPHHAPTTTALWNDVLGHLYSLTPCIEPIRPGLALADIRPPGIVKPLLSEWGAHGGVADDRTTAELAALTTQPGTLRTVRPGCSPAFLRRVSLTVLDEVGVRADIIERAGWFDWHTVAHLRRLTKRQLVAQFDQGELLYRYAQANDTRAVATYRLPETIETHFAFDEAAHEPSEIEPVIDLLIQQACEQLNSRVVQSVSLCLETNSGALRQHRLLREATSSGYSLRHAAQDALQGVLRAGMAVYRVDVTLGHLAQPRAVQGQLFGTSRPAVRIAIQAVEHRFPGALRHFRVLDPQAYLPEEFARLEPITLLPEKPTKPQPVRARRRVKARVVTAQLPAVGP